MPAQLELDRVQETLLLTLYARAKDSALPRPVLGDTRSAELAGEIARETGYDFAKLKASATLARSTALRAKRLDETVRAFVASHPDAVVLDLGCGLDTRVFRCDPPPGVDWYDVDYPAVAELRQRFLPSRSHLVGTDLTEPGWFTGIPADRPAMIVAEGVLPFLPGESFASVIRALTTHFVSGELALNGYTRFAARAMKYHPTIKALGIAAAHGFDDPHEPERWGAGLVLAEEQFLTRAPEAALFDEPTRTVTRLFAHSTALSRQGARILRYRF
ncbi:class I SAM-dependent methyltransferase [Amycolatopsis minnesotensis]|uniref:Class I SAM-dependent methyltransferase n=1 Tax=Amycolatopsis minnesotensis TaxID=337894 RepID=A0ABP5D0T9_9PSEU